MKIYTAAMLIEIARKKPQQPHPQTPARDAGSDSHLKLDLAFATAASR